MDFNKKEKANKPIIILLFLFILISIICIFFNNQTYDSKISFQNENYLSENWNYNNESIVLPKKTHLNKGDTIILTNTLPSNIKNGDALYFTSNYCINKIYIDNKLVFSYGDTKQSLFGNMTGNIKCIVDLKEEYSNKEIKWEITSYYNTDLEIRSLGISTKDNIIFKIFLKNIFKIIPIFIFTLISLILVGIQIMRKTKNISHNYKASIYAALLLGALAIWTFCDSDLPQFLFNNNNAISFISFMSLAIMPVAYNEFAKHIYKNEYKILNIIQFVGITNIFLQLILFIFNIKDPIEFLLVTHTITIVNLIFNSIISFKNRNNGKDYKSIFYGMMLFAICAIFTLIQFYKHPSSELISLYMGTGFMILFISELYIIVNEELLLMKELVSSNIYKKLAFEDILTNLDNRASFELFIKEKENEKIPYISFIMCDLNFLKETNDNYGHEAGDELIKASANILNETFKDVGKCFRLGGDEFIVVVTKENMIKAKIQELNYKISNYKTTTSLPFSIAYGYSEAFINENHSEEFKKLQKEADNLMYKMKQNQHKQLKNTRH